MSDVLDRLVMLLAAANLSRREISEIHNAIRRHSPEELFWRVNELRHSQLKASAPRPAERRTIRSDSNWTVGERVAKLLKEEADLSSGMAHNLLINAMIKDGLIDTGAIPPVSKKAFHDWVDRLTAYIPPRELLRIATEIRNGVVGDDSADWLTSPKAR